MEFVQYHPTGLPGTGILITEAARGEGGILVNRHGDRYLRTTTSASRSTSTTRDTRPCARWNSVRATGCLRRSCTRRRTAATCSQGPHGTYVHLDVRHLGEKRINQKIPFVRELTKNYVGIDPVHEPIPVRPVVHYMMGGIDTDTDTATSLPGLYAAGECACVSINGANRLGSNSLVEILVFGARAGQNAAQWAREHPTSSLDSLEKQADSEQQRIATGLHQPGRRHRADREAARRAATHDGVRLRHLPHATRACVQTTQRWPI